MRNSIILLVAILCLSACKKAVYKRNCCEQSGGIIAFFGGYLTVPNAFTPNGDGMDDKLVPITYGVDTYTLRVVLGKETLFEGTNEGWDGKVDGEIEDGIYGYVIDIETSKGDIRQIRGQVCAITDPANACIREAANCIFEHQFVPDTDPETIGEYDTENFPGPVFCEE